MNNLYRQMVLRQIVIVKVLTAFVVLKRMSDLLAQGTLDNATQCYTYDAAGRQITKTDALNHQILYAYDTRSRLTTKTYPDNTKAQFTYTLTGKRLTAVDKRGTAPSFINHILSLSPPVEALSMTVTGS